MNIVVATPLYPPDIGGPATYITFLERQYKNTKTKITVVSFSRVRRLPVGVRHLCYFGLVFYASLRANLVYALDPVSVGVPARIASILTWTPFILRVPGDYAWEQGVRRFGVAYVLDEFAAAPKPFFVRVLFFLEGWVARTAAAVVVPSVYLKNIVLGWGVASKHMHVIYNTYVGAEIESGSDISATGAPTIISAGRLVPWKGFRQLIKIFPDVIAQVPDVKLYIAGDGPNRAELEEFVAQLNLEGRVVFLGSLTHEALSACILEADVFALYTAYEGFSHQLLEAMALSTPVVTTDVGGNPELITDGVEGKLSAYGDLEAFTAHIITLLTDVSMHTKMRIAAKEKSKTFTAARHAQALERVWADVSR